MPSTHHQILIFAKVLGVYRTLLALSSQSLKVHDAARLAPRLLKLFSDNAHILRQEVKALEDPLYELRDKACPCPHLGALVLSDPQLKRFCTVKSVQTDLSALDNDSGQTMFDITDPFAPTYGFVSLGGHGEVPKGTPVDAETYVLDFDEERYMFLHQPAGPRKKLGDLDVATRKAVAELKKWKVMDASVLNSSREEEETLDDEPFDEDKIEEFEKLLASAKTRKVIEQRAREAHTYLRLLSPFPETHIRFVVAVLRKDIKDGILDVSGWSLAGVPLISVVSDVLADAPSVTTLNLSHNQHVSALDVSDILKLSAAKRLQRIILFNNRAFAPTEEQSKSYAAAEIIDTSGCWKTLTSDKRFKVDAK